MDLDEIFRAHSSYRTGANSLNIHRVS